jgi:glycosyltransferase involved in cell wall biosynthesis
MRKKRILMVAENNVAKSGFGLYTREILSRLHKTGKYQLAELSAFNVNIKNNNVPWKVYPNAVGSGHEHFKQYNSDPENVFGKWRFDQVVLDFKPDIVFDIRDYWMLAFQETSLLRPYFHWVISPTVDSLPQQYGWMQTFANADVVSGHTDWAIEYMNSSGYNINTTHSVSDSVDTDVFKPINYCKNTNKALHMVPQDSFIIGSVMRNQKRKLIPNLMGVVRDLRLLRKDTNIYLYFHTSYPEKAGWDIPSLLQEYEAYNFTLFSYFCSGCSKAYASLWKGPKTICPFCSKKTSSFPNVVTGLSDKHLKNIYNTFDVYVQYAICEGLGIPQLEAASCGIPVFSVDYSAMNEVTTKLEAGKVPYALFKELETGAFRAVPNDKDLVKQLYQYLDLTEEQRKTKGIKIREKILENYSWDKTAKRFEEIFDKLEPKNIWDNPLVFNSQNPTIPPEMKSNRDWVGYAIENIVMSPHLLKTNFIQKIIHNLDTGYVISGGNVVGYGREQAKKVIEGLLNHKAVLEKIRSGQVKDNSDFIKG